MKQTIVVAWLVDDVEVDVKATQLRRLDLGERPVLRQVKMAKAAMWRNKGDDADLKKAHEYAAGEGYRVFVYPTTERDPLGRARRDIKEGA